MIKVKEIQNHGEWTSFINFQVPNTFLQTWPYKNFNELLDNKLWALGVYKDDELRGVALTLKIIAKRGSFIFCPHGPILSASLSPALAIDALNQKWLAIARSEKCNFIRVSPLMIDSPSNLKIFSNLGYRGAPIHMHPELSWILDISTSEDEIMAGMRKNTRYSIRKAERDGVTISSSFNPDDLDKFWKLYTATARRQSFTPFARKYIDSEFSAFDQAGNAALFFAKYEGRLVSTAFIVYTKTSAFYHHGASIAPMPSMTASHLLQWHSIQEAKRRGCAKYNFWGISPENNKKHPWTGLTLFKKGFGGLAEAYLHAQDLPVSAAYWVNYLIETTRRIKRGY